MAHRIVTFQENGVDKISDYSDSKYTNEGITILLHNDSYRKNLVKFLKDFTGNKPLDSLSEVSLGYALEKLKEAKIYSTISKIEFHNKPLKQFGGTKY